jgi:hypothetical protein
MAENNQKQTNAEDQKDDVVGFQEAVKIFAESLDEVRKEGILKTDEGHPR